MPGQRCRHEPRCDSRIKTTVDPAGAGAIPARRVAVCRRGGEARRTSDVEDRAGRHDGEHVAVLVGRVDGSRKDRVERALCASAPIGAVLEAGDPSEVGGLAKGGAGRAQAQDQRGGGIGPLVGGVGAAGGLGEDGVAIVFKGSAA